MEENFNDALVKDLDNSIKTAVNAPSEAVNVGTETSETVTTATADANAEVKQSASFLTVNSFADYVKEGLEMPEPKELIKHIVVEHESTMFFGDTGLGKSIHAVQMANEIAEQGYKTMYCNFELSQTQLAKRYPDKKLSENLLISNIVYAKMHDVTEQSQILGEIEKKAMEFGCEVLVIDNLTNLCVNSKEGSEAGRIMLELVSLRMTHNWTMLILAHVPKRKASDPLTINDLAGSKILSNLADNVVGINKSKLGVDKRYLIQLKYRSFPIELDYKNVLELRLTTEGGFLHFEYGDYGEERSHLPRPRDEKAELERDIIKALKEPNGLSYRDIADKLGTSLATVQRVAKQHGLNRKQDKGEK